MVIVLVISVLGMGFLMLFSPPRSAFAAVIAAPGASFADTAALVVAADGQIVRTAGFDNILIARFPDAAFADTLKAAGAWFVTDPLAFGGCGPKAL